MPKTLIAILIVALVITLVAFFVNKIQNGNEQKDTPVILVNGENGEVIGIANGDETTLIEPFSIMPEVPTSIVD